MRTSHRRNDLPIFVTFSMSRDNNKNNAHLREFPLSWSWSPLQDAPTACRTARSRRQCVRRLSRTKTKCGRTERKIYYYSSIERQRTTGTVQMRCWQMAQFFDRTFFVFVVYSFLRLTLDFCIAHFYVSANGSEHSRPGDSLHTIHSKRARAIT